MTHEYYIKYTTRDLSTGLISVIKFNLLSKIGDDKFVGSYSVPLPGSADDSGFIAFDSLTPSDLLSFINKYGGDADANNGLELFQSSNSGSLATLMTPISTNDLPPNVNSGKITV
jgi:hypothetical protein|tara:strand:+ start:124 stop:468 length:345 start_codon:yes stop_codon:yes gene_type:complete